MTRKKQHRHVGDARPGYRDFSPSDPFEGSLSRYNELESILKMAKKKTTDSPAPETAAPKRRRAPVTRVAEPAQPQSVANDRDLMPEPAGERVTPADASESDSVTFVVSPTENRPTYEEIAEAAYHRYLNRGAGDGQDFDDWITAEQALKAR
jgi:hypothetical protein